MGARWNGNCKKNSEFGSAKKNVRRLIGTLVKFPRPMLILRAHAGGGIVRRIANSVLALATHNIVHVLIPHVQ